MNFEHTFVVRNSKAEKVAANCDKKAEKLERR